VKIVYEKCGKTVNIHVSDLDKGELIEIYKESAEIAIYEKITDDFRESICKRCYHNRHDKECIEALSKDYCGVDKEMIRMQQIFREFFTTETKITLREE
jgi:hypothetical protein